MTRPNSLSPRLEVLEDRTLLADGALDPAFGDRGVVRTDLGGNDFAAHVAVQPDGKVLVAGTTTIGFPFPGTGPSLARYNSDGSLDPGFGVGGLVVMGPGRTESSVSDLVLQPDGRIVLAGATSAREFASGGFVVRFNADGSADPSFQASLRFGGVNEGVAGLAAAPDGRLVVLGLSDAIGAYVARLQPDGALDPTFGEGGLVRVVSRLFPIALSVQPDGRTLVVGSAVGEPSVAVLRLGADGQPDPTFGAGGRVVFAATVGAEDSREVLLAPDGRILVIGTSSAEGTTGFVIRLTPGGAPDGAFGDGGLAVLPGIDLAGGALQAGGQLAAAGTAGVRFPGDAEQGVIVLVRFTPGGAPDPAFGDGGVVRLDSGDAPSRAGDVAVTAGERLVAAGSVGPPLGRDFLVAQVFGVDDRTAADRFVFQVYLDLLNRAPEQLGLTFWSGLVDQGVPRGRVVRLIQQSLEYRGTVVRDAYRLVLRRDPDALGFAVWTDFLRAGGTQEQLEAFLFGSVEFALFVGPAFLAGIYETRLGRTPDPIGDAFWRGILADGTTRAEVSLSILLSPEGTGRILDEFYAFFLGRPLDPLGSRVFGTMLRQGAGRDAVIAALLGSDEYFARI
jgi:uncharacterized delta-60 repeat protein